MSNKGKAPGNGALTGNSEKLINRYYTRNSSRKQFPNTQAWAESRKADVRFKLLKEFEEDLRRESG